ncbi:MAG: glutamine--tRNA ligase/YqeY domain fusion protein [Pigmentiphaga sp.]|nr:glutamine--tRNA ligase/YqeY domain fusion protein [Pigmentiphaga sp.]
MTATDKNTPSPTPHFLRHIIEDDLAANTYATKRWAGRPGPAAVQADAPYDAARIRTRFPPEPNGYLHIGHAKSIALNFGLAEDYNGVCHLRLDDTNPEKEEQRYVDSIIDAVHWLGFDWNANGVEHYYHASDYFDFMYEAAMALIKAGLAYVDEQTAEQMRETRGTLTEPGVNSPWRDRPAEESLRLFDAMRKGEHPDGSMVLRAKIDMASPNMNLRDPAIYRIRHATHHRTGDAWCIYPMYTYAHPIEDALEGITHSFCTLEFEDQRPFYEWVLDHLADLGLLLRPLPRQIEFSRLNLTYIITSKRKLMQLVTEGHVNGWDDPRLPTIVGLRRRGYTPEAIRLLCDRTGASKNESWIDYSVLEQCLREVLDPVAPRSVAVVRPLKLVLTNYPEGQTEPCFAPVHPHYPERGQREFPFSRDLWIEEDDFTENPPKGFFRLFPGNTVRLKYGYIIRCTGCTKDASGRVIEVQAEYLPDTKSGTPGADSVKVKGNITWLSASAAIPAEFRLYDRLFLEANPNAGEGEFTDYLNPDSMDVLQGFVEPGTNAAPDTHYQFERFGYFVADREDSRPEKPVFNRSTTLRDTWVKK